VATYFFLLINDKNFLSFPYILFPTILIQKNNRCDAVQVQQLVPSGCRCTIIANDSGFAGFGDKASNIYCFEFIYGWKIVLVLPPTSMKLFEEIHIKVIDQERKKKDTKLWDGIPHVFVVSVLSYILCTIIIIIL
jgi:hypothetical protein